MIKTRFLVWPQPGQIESVPQKWGRVKVISIRRYDEMALEVEVEGEGSDAEQYIKAHRDVFSDWKKL